MCVWLEGVQRQVKSARVEAKGKTMSIRNDARILYERAEKTIRRNPNTGPDADLVSDMKRILAEGQRECISDVDPQLDGRRWAIPDRWTLESIRDLAHTIYKTAEKHDKIMAPEL